jgi:8-hydroxy-5-deazaflavin:NADPH oxidoreductase
MQIAIIGSGNLGGALGRSLTRAGHSVVLGVRDPAQAAESVKGDLIAGMRVESIADAVGGAQVVIVTTPAGVVVDVVQSLGAALNGKIVVDASNPVGAGLILKTGPNGESQAELTAAALRISAPDARVVKAFNQTGAANIEIAASYVPRPLMLAAGDDADAVRTVAQLATDIGFDGISAGPLTRARELERLAMLWIALSASPAAGLGRNFVVSLVRRPA